MAAKNHVLARKQRKEEEKAGVPVRAQPEPLALSPAYKILLFWAAMHLLRGLGGQPTPQLTKHLVLSQCFSDFHTHSLS